MAWKPIPCVDCGAAIPYRGGPPALRCRECAAKRRREYVREWDRAIVRAGLCSACHSRKATRGKRCRACYERYRYYEPQPRCPCGRLTVGQARRFGHICNPRP